MEHMRTLLDRLGTVSQEERARLRALDVGVTSGGLGTGLKLSAGDRVVDVTTGQRGIVREYHRLVTDSVGLWQVLLSDGRVVYRTERELELDRAPTPAPER